MTKLCKECNGQDCENPESKRFGWCNKPCDGDLPPSPPGDTIKDICQEKGISTKELGRMLKLSDVSIGQLLYGTLAIDEDLAYRLSKVLGSSAAFWMNREKHYRDALASWLHPSTKGGEHR